MRTGASRSAQLEKGKTGPITSSGQEAVTVVFSWQVTQGRDEDFTAWKQGITHAAMSWPGAIGSTTLNPEAADGVFHTVLHFSDADRLSAWLDSAEHADWRLRLNGVATERRFHATGMETWFDLPGRTATPPPRWKMVLVTFVAVYPLSLLFSAFLAARLGPLPLPVRALVFPVLLIPLLTYLLMPRLSRLLRRWLYPDR